MNVPLFVEILNQYLYYFETSCEAVTIQYLNGLIALINNNMGDSNSVDGEAAKTTAHYKNTLQFIRWKKESDTHYQGIEV